MKPHLVRFFHTSGKIFIMKKYILSACVGLLAASAVSAQQVDRNIVPYRSGAKWGFSDLDRKITVTPKYDEVGWFSEGLAPVRVGSKWGYVNTSGKLVIPAKFTVAKNFRRGYMPTKTGGDTILFAGASVRADKYEICINSKGATLPKCPAIAENSVVENRVPVKTVTTQKVYSLDNSGGLYDKIVDDYQVDGAQYYVAQKNGKYGIINAQFQNTVPYEYDKITIDRSMDEPYLQVTKNDLMGIMGTNGQLKIQPENTSIHVVRGRDNKNYAVAQRGNKFYVRNMADNSVVADGFNNITYDDHGFVVTDANNLQGYYYNGRMINPKYKKIEWLNDNYLRVTTANGRVGYISTAGDEYFKD